MAVKRKMFLLFCLYPFVLTVHDCLLINGALSFIFITGFPMLLTGWGLIGWTGLREGADTNKHKACLTPVWEVTRFESWKQTDSRVQRFTHCGKAEVVRWWQSCGSMTGRCMRTQKGRTFLTIPIEKDTNEKKHMCHFVFLEGHLSIQCSLKAGVCVQGRGCYRAKWSDTEMKSKHKQRQTRWGSAWTPGVRDELIFHASNSELKLQSIWWNHRVRVHSSCTEVQHPLFRFFFFLT